MSKYWRTASLISTLLGTTLPGPGTMYLGQTLHFERPVAIGDRMTVTVTVTEKEAKQHRVSFDCHCTNQRGEVEHGIGLRDRGATRKGGDSAWGTAGGVGDPGPGGWPGPVGASR